MNSIINLCEGCTQSHHIRSQHGTSLKETNGRKSGALGPALGGAGLGETLALHWAPSLRSGHQSETGKAIYQVEHPVPVLDPEARRI